MYDHTNDDSGVDEESEAIVYLLLLSRNWDGLITEFLWLLWNWLPVGTENHARALPYQNNSKGTAFFVQNLHFDSIYKLHSEIKLFQLKSCLWKKKITLFFTSLMPIC